MARLTDPAPLEPLHWSRFVSTWWDLPFSENQGGIGGHLQLHKG